MTGAAASVERKRPPGAIRVALRPLVGWGAPATVGLLGVSSALALGGIASGDMVLALGAGAGAAIAATLLVAGEWVDPLVLLVLVLPLPALYASGGLRLPPAAPVTGLAVVGWFLAWGPGRRPLRTGGLRLWAVAAFLGSHVLAGAFSAHRVTAARELLNLSALMALLVVAADLVARRPDRARVWARVVAAVAGVTGVLAVMEMAGVIPGSFPDLGPLNRAALGFGQPNGLGLFLAVALPLAVHVARSTGEGPGRVVAAAGVLAVLAGLLATFSRGAWLSVLTGSAVLFLVGEGRLVLRFWAVGILGGLAVDVATGGGVSDRIVGVFLDWTVAQRFTLMWAGVRLFLENPLLGVGPGGFAEELDRIGALVPALWDMKDTPHNAYIQAAAEAGIVGLAGFLTLLGSIFWTLFRSAREEIGVEGSAGLRTALLWSFAIVLMEGMVEWPFSHGPGQLVVLIAAVGSGLAGVRLAGPAESTEPEAS